MTLPPIKAGVQESVQAYVLRCLVDAGKPMTSEEIMAGCPSHFTPSSCSKAASRLYALAILGRQRLYNGKRGVTYQWYVTDLNRIPKDFCWEAHPERSHGKPRHRHKLTTEHSDIAGQCDGEANTQEEPVASHDQPAPVAQAAPPAPRTVGPGVVIVVAGKAKQLSFADARYVYAQLRDLFG